MSTRDGDQFVNGSSYAHAFVPVDPVTLLPTSTSSPVTGGAQVDHSGSIATGGTAVAPLAADPNRRYLEIQNPTNNVNAESLWISFDTTAVVGSPSIEVPLGVTRIWGDGTWIPTGALSLVAATTGTKYTVKVG